MIEKENSKKLKAGKWNNSQDEKERTINNGRKTGQLGKNEEEQPEKMENQTLKMETM